MKSKTRHKRSSANRSHLMGLLASVALVLAGLGSIGLGIYAWTQPRPPITPLEPGVAVTLTTSPLFDPGSTVFALGEGRDAPEPGLWHCSVERNGLTSPLTVRPNFDSVGSRVLTGEPYIPVVTVGPTRIGDRVTCSPESSVSSDLAVMPTDVGVRSVPLAFVVGGIASLGIAGLVHPRGRGLRRFGA